jgi:hypothetical protein
MPSPKSGTAGSAVEPTDPAEAQEADKADPGEVEQIKAGQIRTQTGKYGSVKVKPFKASDPKKAEPEKTSWIAIRLVDEENQPVPGEKYRITLPDGETVAQGTLDQNGAARLEGIPPGSCKITFPDLDKEAWKEA